MNARKKLTVVCGNAGVGKTTWAKRKAAETNAVVLDIDTASEALVVAALTALGRDSADRDSAFFKATFRDAIHRALFSLAEDNLDVHPCVVVAPFTTERRQPSFKADLTARFRTEVEVVYLTCADQERRARIISRGNPRDLPKLSRWEEYRKTGEDPGPPPYPHTLIDTSE